MLDYRAKLELWQEIKSELEVKADVAFDPETAVDSDGTDQGERDGILQALETVREIFSRTVPCLLSEDAGNPEGALAYGDSPHA